MEKIEVRYSALQSIIYGETLQHGYHKYLVYTDSDGIEWAARGQPSYSPSVTQLPIAELGALESSASSPYGRITTWIGEYPESRDFDLEGDDPTEIIATAPSLASAWEAVKTSLANIEAANYEYRPLSQNSNTTIDQALLEAGLPLPTLGSSMPAGPGIWVPGSGGFLGGAAGVSAYLPSERQLLNSMLRLSNWLSTLSSTIPTAYTAAQAFRPTRDPLVLDLDGDGLETVGPSASAPILFDHDGDGIKTGTGWIKADDGFLVLDRNGNGVIDNGTELFGDATPLSAGGQAADGFAALAQEDTNSDGRVDSLDTRWANLRVWRDLNQDGLSQAGELFTPAALNITAIAVAKTENSRLLPDGNQIADLGSYTRSDGSLGTAGTTGRLADIDLAIDTFHRQFPDTVPPSEAARALPTMQGSGLLRDLREAASSADVQFATDKARTEDLNLVAVNDTLADLPDIAGFGNIHGLHESMAQRTAAIGNTHFVKGTANNEVQRIAA